MECAAGVERFLDRIAALRDGKANGVSAETARAAVEILATRKIIDPQRESQLRGLISAVRQGARPDEVVPAPAIDSRRVEVAAAFITWLNEWRERSRASASRGATTGSRSDWRSDVARGLSDLARDCAEPEEERGRR